MGMIFLMVEKMTAVWLIIITIIACASVPAIIIYVTAIPQLLAGVFMDNMNYLLAISH